MNRIWNEYFGKGIIGTVSDFGKAGDKPTNPELLDYLADNFVKDGWSVKKLHRQILLSSVYRQSSEPREDVASADAEDKLLAVFPRKRLDAEQIRDSYLAVAGKLEDKVGGPSVFPPDSGQFERGPGLARVEESAGSKPPQHLRLHAAQRSLSASGNLRHVERPAGA